MEHLPCNVWRVLLRLTMALQDDGLHMFSLPVLKGGYEEDLDLSIGMLFKIPNSYDLLQAFTTEELTRASIPPAAWHNFSSDTIFTFIKVDLRV